MTEPMKTDGEDTQPIKWKPKRVHEKIELAEKLINENVEIETVEDGGGCYVAGSRSITLEEHHKELEEYAAQQVAQERERVKKELREVDLLFLYDFAKCGICHNYGDDEAKEKIKTLQATISKLTKLIESL